MAQIDRFDTDPARFLKKANAINKTLHDNDIAVGDRAKVMGALLLALADDTIIRIYDDPTKMVEQVNGNIRHILRDHGKEDFADTICLTLPATAKNHFSYRKSIVETIQHLREMNVRSAINGSDDALGQFYETFLKYANGAKEMGIVLTPRHITQFATDVLGVSPHDKVFDPTCGTGGFLVSAMDDIRRQHGTGEIYEEFKQSGIFGVEKEDSVYGLALVNMIFRGDGKSGLQDGDCFDHEFWQRDGQIFLLSPDDIERDGSARPFSRVFMNPPFKKLRNPETKFVDYALRQMKPGGLLFAILPAISIGGDDFSEWRKQTLKRHNIKGVVKLDKSVFYPVQEGTYGLIIEAHKPHIIKQRVFMGILFDDRHRPRRSKLLSSHGERDNMKRMTTDLQNFIIGKPLSKNNIPREQILTPLNIEGNCLFSPEAYIDTNQESVVTGVGERGIHLVTAKMRSAVRRIEDVNPVTRFKEFSLSDFIKSVEKPPLKALKNYDVGNVPVVSATAKDNGINGWRNVPDEMVLKELISISKTHNTKPCQAFWHPYNFTAINTVHLVRPIEEFSSNLAVVLYLCQAITEANAWRYDYARPVKLDELIVFLPVTKDGAVDYKAIDTEARRQLKGVL